MAWERVTDVEIETLRFAVPGGWLYRAGTSTVFVPTPTKQGEKVTQLETVLDRLVSIADKLIPAGGSNSELAEAENAICAAYHALGKKP